MLTVATGAGLLAQAQSLGQQAYEAVVGSTESK